MAATRTAAPAARSSFWSAIQISSSLEDKRPEDMSPQGDEFRIVSMARIGKIDGELGLDVRRKLVQNNNPGGEPHGFLDVVRNEDRREAFVTPEREKLGLQGQPRQ